MNSGFITLHRKILNWEWYDDINTKVLFLHCLLKANHADKKWRGKLLKRGTFASGRISLANETGLSQQNIRTSLKKLQSTNELTIVKDGICSIISITNYEKFQGANQRINQTSTKKQPATNQELTTTKELNNDNNENNIEYMQNCFAEFWSFYTPVKTEKGFTAKGSKLDAEKKYIKILKSGADHEEIIRGLEGYLRQCQANNTLTKAVSTWLNQKCWEDDYNDTYIVSEQKRSSCNNALRFKQEMQAHYENQA